MLAHLKRLHDKVLFLQKPVVFSATVSPICLPYPVTFYFSLLVLVFTYIFTFTVNPICLPNLVTPILPLSVFNSTFIFSFSLSLLVFTFTLFVSLRAGLSQQRQKLEGPFASCKIPSKKNLPLYSRDFVVSPVSRHF